MGRTGLDGIVPAMGDVIGTAVAALTPRFPISVDPKGIPVRAAPPGVIGDVDAGVEDDAMLLEPEPHIPDIPEVSNTPDVVDSCDDIEIPAVAGAAVPIAIPPPSKLAVDPNMDDGAVPKVEHVMPLLGVEIVPVALAEAGLVPGDAISVEPSGMPVGATVELVTSPSGEVGSKVGVGVAIPVTCAMAVLQTNSVGRTMAISENRIAVLRLKSAPLCARLSWSMEAGNGYRHEPKPPVSPPALFP
jgi:hypothetical protein